ncbi:alpha/beta hydrolase, partial [Streptomyces sp. SID10244]|nr:alpha/beta hydrolase [Streptomyces sp. SID10244]
GLLDVAAPGEPVDAIGASMGAATIVYAALAEPDRFRRLVLVTPPTIWGTRRAMATERLESADLIDRHGLAAFERVGVD